MKKELLMMTAALAILACSQEKPEFDEGNPPQTKAGLVDVTPSDQVVYASAGSSTVYTVSAPTGTNWSVEFNVPWIHASPKSGVGPGTFICTADSCNTVDPGRTGAMTVQFGNPGSTLNRYFYQMCQSYPQQDNYLTEHVEFGRIYVTSAYPVGSNLRIKVYGTSSLGQFSYGEVTMKIGSQRSTEASGNYDRVLTVWPYHDGIYHYRHR